MSPDRAESRSRRPGLSLPGLVGALIGYLLALTPSLLPRPPFFAGLVAGVAAAVGYLVAVAIAALLHHFGVPRLGAGQRRLGRIIVAVAAVLVLLPGLVVSAMWQNEIRTAIGAPTQSAGYVVAAVVSVLVLAALLAVGRLLLRLFRRVARPLKSLLPRPIALTGALLLVAAGTYAVISGLLIGPAIAVVDAIYAQNNEGSADGVQPPTSDLRSGSPTSVIPWESLGREGRTFVAGGPGPEDITAVTGRPAVEPIRVYAGLESASTPEERAELAVAELSRTDAFARDVLVVSGVAGTGWLEPQSIDGIEYIWSGSTAFVASQYSYLPSWISFLVDAERARAEGTALFDAVRAAWQELPEDERPRLIAYGLSLGSTSIQGPFGDLADMAEMVDGAVLAGTPNVTEPWRSITAGRDPGSPQWQPTVDGGSTVRFADDAADLAALGAWQQPRVAYLQHSNDPVVWWNFDLIAQRPDWLAEPRGPSVSPRMHWIPVVTFLQVTVDQFFGVNQPNGQGHNYSLHMAQTWVEVVGAPEGWSDADTTAVQRRLTG